VKNSRSSVLPFVGGARRTLTTGKSGGLNGSTQSETDRHLGNLSFDSVAFPLTYLNTASGSGHRTNERCIDLPRDGSKFLAGKSGRPEF
jgi:hypothetical protein